MQPPTLQDVYAARPRVYDLVKPTPLMRHPLLAAETGLDIFVKHENHNPTGAFKIRGGLNLIGSLSAAERRGVIAASTGNHGQSIALACQRQGVPCTIVVPVGNNPEKNQAIRAYGADVVECGRDFDQARERAEAMQHERGLRYVHSANEPLLIAGVATYALEIFEALPDADLIIVPIGGGSGACGCAIVRTAAGSRARVVGVQAERADAFTRSWRARSRVVGERAETFAEGMATRVTFDLTFGILQRELDDIVTLSEDELAEGVRLALRATHNLAEGAGAAPLMAAMKLRDRFDGKKVVCVMSGGNIDRATLARIVASGESVVWLRGLGLRVLSASSLVLLAPILFLQARHVRRVTPRLPEADGPREGLEEATGAATPALRLVVVGESTAVGVGVAEQTIALAGQTARALSAVLGRAVSWRLLGRSGATARALVQEFIEPAVPLEADIVVVVLGVNDTLGFSSPARWIAALDALLAALRRSGPSVPIVVAAVPPMQHVPAFPSPLRHVLGLRAHLLDRAAAEWATTNGAVVHVPHPRPSPADLSTVFCADGFHPSAIGYERWGAVLAEAAATQLLSQGR